MQGARAEGDVGAYRRGAGNDDPGPPSAACGGTAAGPDARPPPRPARAAAPRPADVTDIGGPRLTCPSEYSLLLAPGQRAWGPAAECEVISARALRAQTRRISPAQE